ncbi:hypothetical protein [Propioniciclava tarda]|uniref:Uncharacterized protein n=1 Tax=Propioniciclava tarda TaxID=433330 RepID=A0A4Q9KLK1_PROTD|nr:hypothetical protein [Propioniciclava tarda]TBT95105.1 hypothetical protein ET996_07555 [Propioniciclava tarda]SMO56133.1 hypothetical protein SAMN06266982_106120 [Propioniciclava tarda]
MRLHPTHTAAALAVVGLLAGCTMARTPTVTTPAITPSPTTTSSATPSASTTWTGEEAKINDQIQAYAAWLNVMYGAPNGPINDAPKYLTDVAPDNVQLAVQQQIINFYNDESKSSGTTIVTVSSIKPTTAGGYEVRVCADTSAVTVTNKQGQTVDTGPKRGAAVYTMKKGADAVWRIAGIQGVGTC